MGEVEALLAQAKAWGPEMRALREIARECPLSETVKWGQPCYQAHGANVVLIHGFKAYCALLFFKGALLEDPAGLLVRQSDNVQAPRQMRFRSLAEIARAPVKAYIEAAIALEASGAKLDKSARAPTPAPPEFEARLAAAPELASAFAALTPGRQRAYLLHFNSAKQSATRAARIAKCEPAIREGRGLDD